MAPERRGTVLLTTLEAAKRMGVSKRTVERMVSTRRIAHVVVGSQGAGVTRIPDWAVEEYVEQHLVPAKTASRRSRVA